MDSEMNIEGVVVIVIRTSVRNGLLTQVATAIGGFGLPVPTTPLSWPGCILRGIPVTLTVTKLTMLSASL